MFKEKSFKRTITMLRIRRYIFIYFFVAISLVGSWFVVRALTELLHYPLSIVPYIMIAVGITVFFIAFVLSSNIEFKVKQANLEIEIYHKLRLNTAMLTKLLEINGISLNQDNPLVESSTDIIPVTKNKNLIKKESSFSNINTKTMVNQNINQSAPNVQNPNMPKRVPRRGRPRKYPLPDEYNDQQTKTVNQ